MSKRSDTSIKVNAELPEITIRLEDAFTRHIGPTGPDGFLSVCVYTDEWPEDDASSVSYDLIAKIRSSASENGARFSVEHFEEEVEDVSFLDNGTDYNVINGLLISFGGVGGTIAFLKFARDLLLQWLKNRGGRSVTLKVGDKEVRISGTNDINQALQALRDLESFSKEGGDESRILTL